MAAPQVILVSPAADEADVILGGVIQVTFDQAIDTSTLSASTFSLTGPGTTTIFTPDQNISQASDSILGREIVTGTFSFAVDAQGRTVLTFTPDVSLRPNVVYTIRLIGGDALLVSASIANPAGEKLAASYEWSFTTGDLNLTSPPPSSPLAEEIPYIDVGQIRISTRCKTVGIDLSQIITITFPGDIDPTSFDPNDLLVSIEPVLCALDVSIPPGLVTTVKIVGPTVTITITGWTV